MQGDSITVKYWSTKAGSFFDENFQTAGSDQAVCNLIKSRVPDARIIGVTHHHAPSTSPQPQSSMPQRPW